jgi:signal peptidase I
MKRSWWITFALGILMPGVGQIYNSELKKGVLLSLLFHLVSVLSLFFAISTAQTSEQTLAILSLIPLVATLIIFEATLKTYFEDKTASPKIRWYLLPIFYIAIRLFITTPTTYLTTNFLFHKYTIPSESMVPTFLVGDNIVANVYKLRSGLVPQIGSVAIFRNIVDKDVPYAKRIVATSGSRVRIEGKNLFINQEEISYQKLPQKDTTDLYELLPHLEIRIPVKGEVFRFDTLKVSEFLFLANLIKQERRENQIDAQLYLSVDGLFAEAISLDSIKSTIDIYNLKENLRRSMGERVFEFEPMLFVDGEEIKKYTVETDSYFMLGDNRLNSYDSRYFGPISSRSIIGKVELIYSSLSPLSSISGFYNRIRWERVGLRI